MPPSDGASSVVQTQSFRRYRSFSRGGDMTVLSGDTDRVGKGRPCNRDSNGRCNLESNSGGNSPSNRESNGQSCVGSNEDSDSGRNGRNGFAGNGGRNLPRS